MGLSFSVYGDQLDRSSFLEIKVWDVDDLLKVLEVAIGVNKRKNWKENFVNVNLWFLFDYC